MSMRPPSLWDQPLHQWKVTELKDELKRRNMSTKGLKEDLVRRLTEELNEENGERKEIGNEIASPQLATNLIAMKKGHKGAEDGDGSESEKARLLGDNRSSFNADGSGQEEALDHVDEDQNMKSEKSQLLDGNVSFTNNDENGPVPVAGHEQVDEDRDTELADKFDAECDGADKTTMIPVENSKSIDSQNDFCRNELKDSDAVTAGDSQLPSCEPSYQVTETINQVVNSVHTGPLSINQSNELKGDLNTDIVNLETASTEIEVSGIVSNDGYGINMLNVQVRSDGKIASNHKGGGPSENSHGAGKLLGESIEEDVMHNKHVIHSILNSDYATEKIDIPESLQAEEDDGFDSVVDQCSIDEDSFPDKCVTLDQHRQKRKIKVEPLSEKGSLKRPRKLNGVNGLKKNGFSKIPSEKAEALKLAEQESHGNGLIFNDSTSEEAPKSKHLFSRFDSSDGHISIDRTVPPPGRLPTTSLRIDNFLRPFTLKAVQELLSVTGTVCCFWMDHIKTHCYVTYSSVEEALATRDALYNFQWPAKGGRLLTVEFVDPEDVKVKVEGPQVAPSTVPALTSPRVPAKTSLKLQRSLQMPPKQQLQPRQQHPMPAKQHLPLPPEQQLPLPPPKQPPPPPMQRLPAPPKQLLPLPPPSLPHHGFANENLPPPLHPHPGIAREKLPPALHPYPSIAREKLPPPQHPHPVIAREKLPPPQHPHPVVAREKLPPPPHPHPGIAREKLPPPPHPHPGIAREKLPPPPPHPHPGVAREKLPPHPHPHPGVAREKLPPHPHPLPGNAREKLPPPSNPHPGIAREQLPSPPHLHPGVAREKLPPPPPHPHPGSVKEKLPPPRKPDPPVRTLDDIFRKTRASPRIYYLPLSEEQVAAKVAAMSAGLNNSVDSHIRS